MGYIDMHCDTLALYARKGNEKELYQNDMHLDLVRMKEGGCTAQFFAIFLPAWGENDPDRIPDEDYIRILSKGLFDSVREHDDLIRMAGNAGEIEANTKAGRMSAILTMEDGRAVKGDLANLKRFYDLGVRALSLTWNFENCFGFPNARDAERMGLGLKEFGKEAVCYMQEELGMLVDVSHLSDGGFYDVAALCKKPFVATHSNARALSPHPRNLTDDMLRVLGEKGGVTGLNFCGAFLNADTSDSRSTVEALVRHGVHIANKAGVEALAFGSDFDGIGGELEISGCEKMPLLMDGLKKAGFSESDLDKIAYGNVMRVIREAMK